MYSYSGIRSIERTLSCDLLKYVKNCCNKLQIVIKITDGFHVSNGLGKKAYEFLQVSHNNAEFWTSNVDRLGKPPSKEQQLSRTQQFILSSHAAMFVFTHTIWPMRNTADPYDTTTELSPINILPFKENY